LNPLLTLKRGYSITKKNNKVISSAKDVESGDEIDIEFDDGTVNTKVI
jgi:exodeoxyribonuclease VII large subunit